MRTAVASAALRSKSATRCSSFVVDQVLKGRDTRLAATAVRHSGETKTDFKNADARRPNRDTGLTILPSHDPRVDRLNHERRQHVGVEDDHFVKGFRNL